MLSFAFECAQGGDDADVLEIRWTTGAVPEFNEAMMMRFRAVDGRFIVPLDAAPRWLLARDLQKLKIGPAARTACASFELTDVALSQRGAVDSPRAAVTMNLHFGAGMIFSRRSTRELEQQVAQQLCTGRDGRKVSPALGPRPLPDRKLDAAKPMTIGPHDHLQIDGKAPLQR